MTLVRITRKVSASTGGNSVADGASYSFTGPSSTTNTASAMFLGGLDGPIDAGSAGSDFSHASWPLCGNYMPRWDTTQTLSRSKSLGFKETYHWAGNPENSASFGMGLDLGNGFSEAFFSGNVWIQCNSSPNLTELQVKLIRFMPTNDVNDTNPQTYIARWKGGDGFVYPNNDGVFWDSTIPNFNLGYWIKFEFWIRPASAAGAADGAWALKCWRHSDGVQITNISDTGVNDYAGATRLRWLIMQGYLGNASPHVVGGSVDRVTDFTLGGDGEVYWDDVAVQWGANCRRRIVLGDASTFAACNKAKLVYQPWSVWSGTNRTIVVNKGLHASFAGKYLYEIDENDAVVNAAGIEP